MDSRSRQRVEGSTRPGSIPLRPELIELMDAKSLCQYQCCSKVVRADVRESNAWQLLAAQQAPRPTPLTARDALELDAITRVRSQVRRRLLADALAEEDTSGLCVSDLGDFTFFVRIAKGGRLIWEGDVNSSLTNSFGPRIPLTEAWPTIRRSGSCTALRAWLAETGTGWEHDKAVLRPLSITLVAIRDVDQAMVSLGHFSLGDHVDGNGEPDQEFSFIDDHRDHHLFAAPGFSFRAHLYLATHHNAAGGRFEYLDLEVHRYEEREDEDYRKGELRSYQLRYLLTFLAGGQPFERAEAIRTMEEWL